MLTCLLSAGSKQASQPVSAPTTPLQAGCLFAFGCKVHGIIAALDLRNDFTSCMLRHVRLAGSKQLIQHLSRAHPPEQAARHQHPLHPLPNPPPQNPLQHGISTQTGKAGVGMLAHDIHPHPGSVGVGMLAHDIHPQPGEGTMIETAGEAAAGTPTIPLPVATDMRIGTGMNGADQIGGHSGNMRTTGAIMTGQEWPAGNGFSGQRLTGDMRIGLDMGGMGLGGARQSFQAVICKLQPTFALPKAVNSLAGNSHGNPHSKLP